MGAACWTFCSAPLSPQLCAAVAQIDARAFAVPIAIPNRLSDRSVDPRATLRQLLRSDDAAVRGEAALALSLHREAVDLSAIAAIARSDDPQAYVPATLALGRLAVPGVEYVLGELLDARGRDGTIDRRCAAAFALGRLPDGHATPALDAFLARIPGGNYTSHRNLLSAWLAALTVESRPSRRAFVRFLVDDPSNRDPALRALAFTALHTIDGQLEQRTIERLVRSPHADLRLVAMRLLAQDDLRTESLLKSIDTMAARDSDPRVRAAAMQRLADARAIVILDRAADAIESRDDPLVCAAAVRAILKFGGHELRRALEEAILALPPREKPKLASAMLDAWTGDATDAFVASLLEIATHGEAPEELRIAAARAAARADAAANSTAIELVLRGLAADPRFSLTQRALLLRAYHLLGARSGSDPAELALSDRAARHPIDGVAILGLMARDRPLAERRLLDASSELAPAELSAGLRSMACAEQPMPPEDVLDWLPASLRERLRGHLLSR